MRVKGDLNYKIEIANNSTSRSKVINNELQVFLIIFIRIRTLINIH